MKLTPRQFIDMLHDARLNDHLEESYVWRHKKNQNLYKIVGLAYDSDREEIVVQYQSYDVRSPIPFSHLKSRFLDSFERVYEVRSWEPIP